MDFVADPQLAAWLEESRRAAGGKPSLEQIRQLRLPRARPAGPELEQVKDVEVPADVPVRTRLYRSSGGPQPLTVFVHGGGFVFGGLESHDRLCRRLARIAGTAVLAVDYRLAPEHPAPAAVDDVAAVLSWAARGPGELGVLEPGIGLAGDSSGGLIAFLAARRLAGTPARPELLFLAYPNADLSLSLPSTRSKGEGWGLSMRDLSFYISQWIPGSSRDVLADFSPLHSLSTHGDCGPVDIMVATAEHDPLRDEGKLLADRLAAAGASVEYLPHPGLVHGFLTLDTVSPAALQAGDALLGQYGIHLRQVAETNDV